MIVVSGDRWGIRELADRDKIMIRLRLRLMIIMEAKNALKVLLIVSQQLRCQLSLFAFICFLLVLWVLWKSFLLIMWLLWDTFTLHVMVLLNVFLDRLDLTKLISPQNWTLIPYFWLMRQKVLMAHGSITAHHGPLSLFLNNVKMQTIQPNPIILYTVRLVPILFFFTLFGLSWLF